ncbi:effector-associated constant component EACC1 [Streptomyces sp. bgisy130]|uniref:effector-associated constant component EACC1 n=1 Tax=Streptomyces sp. bgisy130 TaxID=3413788 RepID=UPI003F49DB17
MYAYGITVDEGAGGEDLRQLTQWLRDDEFVGEGGVITLVTTPPSSGSMGTAFDAIQLSVDSGFQVANLVLAISLWRRGRTKPPRVSIEHNGVRIEVDSEDPVVVARIVAALEGA